MDLHYRSSREWQNRRVGQTKKAATNLAPLTAREGGQVHGFVAALR
jgi:hypothetical protein